MKNFLTSLKGAVMAALEWAKSLLLALRGGIAFTIVKASKLHPWAGAGACALWIVAMALVARHSVVLGAILFVAFFVQEKAVPKRRRNPKATK